MLIIDRIEGQLAVCQDMDGRVRNIPLRSISGEPSGGAVIIKKGSGYIVSSRETQKRRETIIDKTKTVFKDR